MTNMFRSITETWNPVIGCLHGCVYCFARELANGRLKQAYLRNKNLLWRSPAPLSESLSAYSDPFYPRFWPERLKKKFKPGGFVFVSDMGDLFGPWVPRYWIRDIIKHIRKFPDTDFLFCTKAPDRYHDFDFPKNAVIGVTLETTGYPAGNLSVPSVGYTKAPDLLVRYRAFVDHPHPRKLVSIEPIFDMDVPRMAEWMKAIQPEIIEVGADTLHCGLPEPSADEVKWLLCQLHEACPNVKEKPSLKRLLKEGVKC